MLRLGSPEHILSLRLQLLMEIDLGVDGRMILVEHSVWLDEDQSLLLALCDPEDEIWVKATILKKPDALAPAEIPQ